MYFALSDQLSVYCGYWTTKRDALYTVTVVGDCVQRETDQARSRAIHIHGRPRIVCVTARLDVTPKTTEQNRIVCTGKSEAEVTNNLKKTALEVLYY